MAKNNFTMSRDVLPLSEIGPAGVTRQQVQDFYDRQLLVGVSPREAAIGTENSLNITDLRVSANGKRVVSFKDVPINETAEKKRYIVHLKKKKTIEYEYVAEIDAASEAEAKRLAKDEADESNETGTFSNGWAVTSVKVDS